MRGERFYGRNNGCGKFVGSAGHVGCVDWRLKTRVVEVKVRVRV